MDKEKKPEFKVDLTTLDYFACGWCGAMALTGDYVYIVPAPNRPEGMSGFFCGVCLPKYKKQYRKVPATRLLRVGGPYDINSGFKNWSNKQNDRDKRRLEAGG